VALTVLAVFAVLLPAAVVRGAEVAAAECTTATATVSYSLVYDAIAQADVIHGVHAAGLPIACDGRNLVVVLTKSGVPMLERAAVIHAGEAEILCDIFAPKLGDVDGVSLFVADTIKWPNKLGK
jgi:hypothetical protein